MAARYLLPIGIFWDIENCQVPRHRSAFTIVHRIRSLIYSHFVEAEFIVVCDVKKEHPRVIEELNDSQVNLIHVSSTSKNAADEKLRQSIRRFAEIYYSPAAVALISGDINFSTDLSDLKNRKRMYVILIHNDSASDALIVCAQEIYSFSFLTANLPFRSKKNYNECFYLKVTNLPLNRDTAKVRKRLQFLFNNCGGKLVGMFKTSYAVIRFTSKDFAIRAQKRIQGEDVLGNKINVSHSVFSRGSPFRAYNGQRVRSNNFHAGSEVRTSQVQKFNSGKICGPANYSSLSFRCNTPHPNQYLPHEVIRMQPTSMDLRNTKQKAANVSYQQTQQNKSNTFFDCSFDQFAAVSPPSALKSHEQSQYVDLLVTNLDPLIEVQELRKILIDMIKEFVVVNISFKKHLDGTSIASIRVSNEQEAQFVISQLHRLKLGDRRMSVMYAQSVEPDIDQLRLCVLLLLKEVPNNRMPLFKFVTLFESRYRMNVSVSDIYKLKDICKVTESQGGRMIMLLPNVINSPMPTFDEGLTTCCSIHCPNGFQKTGWGEADFIELPNINISLKSFSKYIYSLLVSHCGKMPLLSLPICYELELKEPLPVDESGVPLEHLVTCIENVELKYGGPNNSIKYLVLKNESEVQDPESLMKKSISLSLMSNVLLFCREVVDLLRTFDNSQLSLNKFIPAYHHHFGRQCRVADYGFVKLADLFAVITHVVQIMGEGVGRILTLAHIAQMRRFTTDLLRVLKSQQSKEINISNFASAYEKIFRKSFKPVDYGVNTLEDLLDNIPENTVVFNNYDNELLVAIPKRYQTAQELAKTKQFAHEVVELLKHAPYCSMLFNKFVPAYHHHFGSQCKVSDYGFSKLIELFEAISDTIKIEELPSGERKISLLLPIAMKILEKQVNDLIKKLPNTSITIDSLSMSFLKEYGYPLKPHAYDCNNIRELLSKLRTKIEFVPSSTAGSLVNVRQNKINPLEIGVWSLLINPPYCTSVYILIQSYWQRFNEKLSVTKLEEFKTFIEVFTENEDKLISLTPISILAAQLYHLIQVNNGKIPLHALGSLYSDKFGKSLQPGDYNLSTLEAVLDEINFAVIVRRSRKRSNLVLNKELEAYGIRIVSNVPNQFEEQENWDSKNWALGSPRRYDTQQSDSDLACCSTWNTPLKSNDSNLSIPLPPFQTPKFLLDLDDLISPTKSLLPANSYYLQNSVPYIASPNPSQLPSPQKLLDSIAHYKEESNDSGVNTFSYME